MIPKQILRRTISSIFGRRRREARIEFEELKIPKDNIGKLMKNLYIELRTKRLFSKSWAQKTVLAAYHNIVYNDKEVEKESR